MGKRLVIFIMLLMVIARSQEMRLEIDDTNVDNLYLMKTDSVKVSANFYDHSTKISPLPVKWSTTGTLHFPDTSGNTAKVSGAQITENEDGLLIATPLDSTIAADSMQIMYNMPFTAESAYTRDINHNGLLDAIDISCSYPVDLPDLADCGVKYSMVDYSGKLITVNFRDDSCKYIDIDKKHFRLFLHEVGLDSSSQCSWEPILYVEDQELKTQDGIPPRIRKAALAVNDSIGQDILYIFFTEKIVLESGSINSNFLLRRNSKKTEMPSLIFHQMSDSVISAELKYGDENVIDDRSLLSLDSSIMDNDGNRADTSQVRVEIISDANVRIRIPDAAVNPSNLSTVKSDFNFCQQDSAMQWYKQGKGLHFQCFVRVPKNGTAAAKLRVFNVLNETVFSAETDNLFSGLAWNPTGITKIDLFWNGQDKKGNILAPDGYGAILTVSSNSGEYATSSDSVAFVFGDPLQAEKNDNALIEGTEKGNCGCGSGAGLAFIPPMVFKANRIRRRLQKK